MAASYRYIAADLVTGKLLGELPLTGVSYGRELNRAGSFSASLAAQSDPALARLLLASTEPSRTMILVERNGQLSGDGAYIVWARGWQGGKIALGGAGPWSYYHRRIARSNLAFLEVAQEAIFEALLAHVHGTTGGDPLHPTVVKDNGNTTLRDRTISAGAFVGPEIEKLCDNSNGFDFSFRSRWEAGALVHRLTIRTFMGQSVAATGTAFALGGNAIDLDGVEDGGSVGNSVFVVGEGTEDATAFAIAESIPDGYPRLDVVVSASSVSEPATLANLATTTLALGRYPTTAYTVAVNADANPELGTWDVGDSVRLDVPAGHPRWPDGLGVNVRLVGWSCAVSDGGLEKVTTQVTEATAR